VDDILTEARDHEKVGLDEYRKLLKLVADKNMMLEEYARAQIAAEELHLAEISKMMRRH
jgi:bacterioferritin